jgi:hypothetical protein
MRIASQVLSYSMKRKYKTKKKNIINLDKFYNKFNKETREDGKTKISTNTFGI